MRNRIKIAFLILPITFAMLACRISLPWQDQSSGAILFQDDFSDPSSGWNQVTAANGETDYADGTYRIFVNEPDMDIWSKPGLSFTDVRVEVEALKVGGDRNNRFGIICRVTEPNTFYTFIISSDGYYGIGKIKGQVYQLIGMDALQPSDVILKGSALNHIRADCVGDRLTLYVNGHQLAEVQDSEFTSGDVGLIAGTYDTSGTDIRFDNFVVYQP
jgi:hypothetical protein